MIKNQKGFTYPLTLMILIAFLIFFSIQVEQFLIEKQMFHETKTILRQEYYMLVSVKKIEKLLQSGNTVQPNGQILFHYGTMDYQIDAPSGNLQKITFTLHLTSSETGLGFAYYDRTLKKINQWVEKN